MSSTRKRCRFGCRFGGVFVTGGTGVFLLWKSPVRPVARVLRRDYFLFVFIIGIFRRQISLLSILHLVLSFEYTRLCRCGVSVIACGTVGCPCDKPRGAGGYQIVTMTTTLFPVFNKSSTSLRRNCCRFWRGLVAGCTGNCHAGNFHCGRLRKLRRNGVFIVFSFWGITSELFDEFAYWFLNYQSSFYDCTAILLSILFHSILFPCISF